MKIDAAQFEPAQSELDRRLRHVLRPTVHALVSEIATQHLVLSPEYSKVTGRCNLDLYPYLRDPMDRLTPDDPTRTVVFCGPIQGGKTIIGQAFLTAVVTHYPGPMLWVTSHDTKAEDFSKTRLDLMIRDSPMLRSLVAEEKSRNKNNTIKLKRFPGGTIKLVGAQSVSGLTSDTIRFVVIDEADDHRENVSGAGSSIALAMGRQTSFGDMAKTLIVSSPKMLDASDIDSWAKRGTERRFEVACPECGEYQIMEPCNDDLKDWNLHWPKGEYGDVYFQCQNSDCQAHWHEVDKPRLLSSGRWSAPTNPAADGSIESFRLNFLYLPLGLYSWAQFARDWDNAVERLKVGDIDEMRSLVNTRMARPFEDRGEGFDPRTIQDRAEPSWKHLPEQVQLITMATDVQGGHAGQSRFETAWIGWGADGEAWWLDYVVTYGDLDQPEIWEKLDQHRARTFETADGRQVGATLHFVDRGFEAQKVLAYTMRRTRYGTYAIKGVEGTPSDAIITAVASRTRLKRVKSAPYFTVRNVPCKDLCAGMLRISQPGPKFLHIPDFIPAKIPNIFEMLTSETRKRIRRKDGKAQVIWTKKNEKAPNEAWDLLNYNLAAKVYAELSGFVFEKRKNPEVGTILDRPANSEGELFDPDRDIPENLEQSKTPVKSQVQVARKKRPVASWGRKTWR